MKKITAIILGIAIIAIGGIFVIAQTAQTGDGGTEKRWGKRGGGMHRGMGGGMHGGGMMFRGLDLTDEQKAQIKAIHEANKGTMQPLMEAMKANRQRMQEATANGAFDEATVTAIANEHGTLAAQMMVARQRVMSQTFAILTPEQKAKAAEMRQKRGEGFKGRGMRRGGKSGGGETANE